MMGIITSAKEFMSQMGNPYVRFNFMDYSGTIELALFKEKYLKFKPLIDKDYILLIQGQTDYSKSKDEMRMNIHHIQLVSDVDPLTIYRSIQIDMTPADLEQGKEQIVSEVLAQFPGKCPLYFNFYDADENMTVRMVSRAGLNFTTEVREMLNEMEVVYSLRLDDRWLVERKDESRRFYNS
jgi:DNA polymerase III alpha subunit